MEVVKLRSMGTARANLHGQMKQCGYRPADIYHVEFSRLKGQGGANMIGVFIHASNDTRGISRVFADGFAFPDDRPIHFAALSQFFCSEVRDDSRCPDRAIQGF